MDELNTRIFAALLFALFVSSAISAEPKDADEALYVQFGDFGVKIDSKISLEVLSSEKDAEPKIKGELGIDVQNFKFKDEAHKVPKFEMKDSVMRMNWGSDLELKISRSAHSSKCHVVKWTSTLNAPLEDCFSFGKARWYGGPEHINQYWPVEKLQLKDLAYVPQMFANLGKTEPYWLNSKGVSIYVNQSVPLFVDTDNHRKGAICFKAEQGKAPYLPRDETILEYTLCHFSDPRQAQEHAIQNFFDKPTGIPDERMIEHPVWSTWVRFKLDVNDTATLDFAKDIVRYGFNNSQIEIDDNWETCYGSTFFNKSRFSNTKSLSDELKKMGFRITIWVHPFVNLDCPSHDEFKNKDYFVKNTSGSVETVWWDGDASVVDFTKPHAVEWFRATHRALLEDNGIDGLKFDAGEISWLPQIPVLNVPKDQHPKSYTSAYADTISVFGPITELRVSHRTQKYPMFVRMLDKDSKWDFENGLPTLITSMLIMNLHGYSWVLPDMVGGNAYNDDKIDKELFIRWLQANTFMPSIQFSAAPWDYDQETIEISKKFTRMHYEYSGRIIELMHETVRSGAPLNPPLWWIDPKNPHTYGIYDEYLLGEDILVAPVLVRGARTRNIYLPRGYWREGNFPHRIFRGRKWLKHYKAPLDTLPFFTRIY